MTHNSAAAILLSLIAFCSIKAQTLEGQILNRRDSSFVEFAIIIASDTILKNYVKGSSDSNGNFKINIPTSSDLIAFSASPECWELQILNIDSLRKVTIDLGIIYLEESPPYWQVSFKDISRRKEQRYQKRIIKSYNKEVKKSLDVILEINDRRISVKPIVRKVWRDSRRLEAIYYLDFQEIVNK